MRFGVSWGCANATVRDEIVRNCSDMCGALEQRVAPMRNIYWGCHPSDSLHTPQVAGEILERNLANVYFFYRHESVVITNPINFMLRFAGEVATWTTEAHCIAIHKLVIQTPAN